MCLCKLWRNWLFSTHSLVVCSGEVLSSAEKICGTDQIVDQLRLTYGCKLNWNLSVLTCSSLVSFHFQFTIWSEWDQLFTFLFLWVGVLSWVGMSTGSEMRSEALGKVRRQSLKPWNDLSCLCQECLVEQDSMSPSDLILSRLLKYSPPRSLVKLWLGHQHCCKAGSQVIGLK